MNMGEYSPGLPYPWPIHFPIHYPSPTPIPPFSQYIPAPQDIPILPGLTSPQRGILPSTFYPPQQIYPSNPDYINKRKKKILQIIDPSTKEEISVERSDNQTPTDSLSLPKQSNSPKLEKLKKQQEFRQLIACAAIKDHDLSPENKIKDEFRFKVSEALTPPLLDDEIYHEDTLTDAVEKLQDPKLSNLIEIPSMEFPNSSLENTILDFTTSENSDTMNLGSKQSFNSIEHVTTVHYEYSRDNILFLQPDVSLKSDIPSEISVSPYFCICITDIFYYNQPVVHLLNNLPIIHAKSREREKMNDRLTWILNRITPENYEKLSKKAIDLVATAETISDLENFIHCIFSKSINEPIYCEFYARLCNDMAKIFIREDSQNADTEISNLDSTKQVTFRRCLLTICQQEFEKDKNDNDQLNQMKLNLESCTDTILKPQLEEDYYLKEKQVHKHSLGNVRLIGQLYRLNMLSENIIHECTVRLLKGRPTDDYLEELCSLFNVVGMDIDKPEAKDRIDQYFERIQHLMNRGFMSTRVKYLLMNLIDLRLNGWCERREKEIPKTLDELHNLCPSQSQIHSVSQTKEHVQSQLIPKGDQLEAPYSSAKVLTSRLPSLKKQSNEIKFRPSGNWSNQYQDLKNSFKPNDQSQVSQLSIVSAGNSDRALSSLEVISELEVIKASTSILKEYDHLNDFDEVRQFLLITYSPSIHPLIICGFFLSLNVTGGKLKSTLIELLIQCYQQGVISQKSIIDGVAKVVKRIFDEDIQEDCPLIFEFIFVALFSIYSQITELSFVSLINAISLSDDSSFEILNLFLQISYDEDPRLLISMITNTEDVISDNILSYLQTINTPLYTDIESVIYLSEASKNQILQIHFPFHLFNTEQMLLDYLSKSFIEMGLPTFTKPLFIIEIFHSLSNYVGEFGILHWVASSFASALTSVPSRFHSLIFLGFLRNIEPSFISKGDNLRVFLSLQLIRSIMTIDMIQYILDHQAVCSPVKDILRSIVCN
eukprot:TRINITY_DN6979_c1_g2_i1.p1 TRINITY_DN6979_c1_g2~~TRINITY_DN6979_c1_g2_i1.p1  ORF type:complete len:997 (-),score=46.40 TRINITY_DN6979_c1_g2_i1:170-3160(-)